MRKVSLIIPIYNALSLIELSLKSVSKYSVNNHKIQTEIIVIIDGSDQYMTDYLRRLQGKQISYRLFENKTNLGFVRSSNIGFKEAEGKNFSYFYDAESVEIILKYFYFSIELGDYTFQNESAGLQG